MQQDRYINFISVFLTFFLQVTVAWLLCYIFARLLRRPEHRFILWLLFSLASTVYWFAALGAATFSTAGSAPNLHLPGTSFRHIMVAASWTQILTFIAWFVAGIYIGGLVILCGRRIWNRFRLRTLLRFGSEPSAIFSAALAELCRELQVKNCELVIVPGITSPATVYWWKPRILLPQVSHRQERLAEFVHIMRHELVHILRRDYLVSSLMDGACTVLFFHPAMWAARRAMRLERELACDLAVVEACPEGRADYAESLVRFVRLSFMARIGPLSVDFAAPASLLGRRVRSILLEPGVVPAWKKLSSAGVGIAMLAAFAFLAPQLSLAFATVPDSGSQFAAMGFPVTVQRMKHHVRSAVVASAPAHKAAQVGYRPPSQL